MLAPCTVSRSLLPAARRRAIHGNELNSHRAGPFRRCRGIRKVVHPRARSEQHRASIGEHSIAESTRICLATNGSGRGSYASQSVTVGRPARTRAPPSKVHNSCLGRNGIGRLVIARGFAEKPAGRRVRARVRVQRKTRRPRAYRFERIGDEPWPIHHRYLPAFQQRRRRTAADGPITTAARATRDRAVRASRMTRYAAARRRVRAVSCSANASRSRFPALRYRAPAIDSAETTTRRTWSPSSRAASMACERRSTRGEADVRAPHSTRRWRPHRFGHHNAPVAPRTDR